MKIAVTGASSHIGLNLVKTLSAQGHKVRALYHHTKHLSLLEKMADECMSIDVCQSENLKNIFDNFEIVYHLAGIVSIGEKQSDKILQVNVDGTKHVAQAALQSKVRRFIHVSSVQSFSRFPLSEVLTEDRARVNHFEPAIYNRSKALGEAAVREVIKQGLDAVIIHPTGVIGPMDFAPSFIGKTLLSYFSGQIACHINGGFNWVHVQDIVDMMIAAALKGRCNESYLIAGHWHSVFHIAKMVEKIAHINTPILTCPIWLAKLALPLQTLWWSLQKSRPLYTADSLLTLQSFRQIDDSKARSELGHSPRTIESAIYDFFVSLHQTGLIKAETQFEKIVDMSKCK